MSLELDSRHVLRDGVDQLAQAHRDLLSGPVVFDERAKFPGDHSPLGNTGRIRRLGLYAPTFCRGGAPYSSNHVALDQTWKFLIEHPTTVWSPTPLLAASFEITIDDKA